MEFLLSVCLLLIAAYLAGEIDDKTKAFQASVSSTAADSDSAVEVSVLD